MSEASNGNGSPGSPMANGVLPRQPGETGTEYLNRKREAEREARAQQEREVQEARERQAQQERERLDALTSRAEQLVQTLERVAGAIPPDLAQQLAAVRSDTQEARSTAAQVRTAATSAGTTVTRAAESFAATTAKAETWHKLLTATEERGTKTAQTIERAAARAGAEVRSVRWRAWLTGGVGPTLLLLVLGLLLWIAEPARTTVAEWLLTDEQLNARQLGGAILENYKAPTLTKLDRCLMEAYTGRKHRGACPPPPPGSGLVMPSTPPTHRRGG